MRLNRNPKLKLVVKYKSITSALILLLFPVFAFGDNHATDAASVPDAAEESEVAIVYDGSLNPNDFVDVSFWLATAMILAAAGFFFIFLDLVK